MAAIFQLLSERFMLNREWAREPEGRDQLNLLRYEAQNLAQDARKQMRQMQGMDGREEIIVNNLEALSSDLEKALERSGQERAIQ